MSNRYSQSRQDGDKDFGKTEKRFVPKKQNPNPSNIDSHNFRNYNDNTKTTSSNQTLSNSLRELDISSGRGRINGSGSKSRTQKGSTEEWVSAKALGANANGYGNFVNYLPQDEAVAAGLGADEGGLDPVESQRVVDLLNRELSNLLKCRPRDFWRQVASDTSLHEFLDSFLQFRSRWYDFPYRGAVAKPMVAKPMVAGVIVGELDLSRRVFMLLYRISSNKDPGAHAADSLSLKEHGVILQEKKLLDLPKLLDTCAIYGHENEDLVRVLVENAIKAQPWIHDYLTEVASRFLGIVHTMQERCTSTMEEIFSSGKPDDRDSTRLLVDYLEVMDFINDATVSLDAFLNAYKMAAFFFICSAETSNGYEDLICTLVRLHDSLLPSLLRGFHIILAGREDEMVNNIIISLKMLSIRIVKFGWRLLDLCYLNEDMSSDALILPVATKMFPVNVEDPVIRGDILVQTFRDISSASFEVLEAPKETFLQNIDNSFSIFASLKRLQDSGWVFIDEEQLQYLSGIMKYSNKEVNTELQSAKDLIGKEKLQMDEDAVITESKISQIKDLFPDYGKGFLSACLAVYDQNPEEVIQSILEGTLHEDLQCLDTSLETTPVSKPSSVRRDDKGKGKLFDFPPELSYSRKENSDGQPSEEPKSLSIGKYVRKGDLVDSSILDKKDEKHSARTVALASQYEYEDEYDDSFDDLGLSVADLGVEENETMSDKMSSTLGKSWEPGAGNPPVSNSKWGSKRKPQFYVKDGKNYSYKVAGAVAVSNSDEASLVTQSQKELIHGLGRGGNFPLGAVRKLTEAYEEDNKEANCSEVEGKGLLGNPDGREAAKRREYNVQVGKESNDSEVGNRGNATNFRGRGRRGRGGGGGSSNHYRKDRAMNKHFSGFRG